MIISYRSKALKLFAETGNTRRLPAANAERVARILALIGGVERPAELAAFPSYRWHPLPPTNRFAMMVSGNYRITFAWDGADAVDVDLEDYH